LPAPDPTALDAFTGASRTLTLTIAAPESLLFAVLPPLPLPTTNKRLGASVQSANDHIHHHYIYCFYRILLLLSDVATPSGRKP
jgi:hypothetical protein